MQKEEFLRIAHMINSIHPNTISGDATNVWHMLLNDLAYEDAYAATQKFLSTSHFPPKPADIREAYANFFAPSENGYADEFARLRSLIGQYGYYRSKEAYEQMSPTMKKFVDAVGWNTLCDCPIDEFQNMLPRFRDMWKVNRSRYIASIETPPRLARAIEERKRMGVRYDDAIEEKESVMIESHN